MQDLCRTCAAIKLMKGAATCHLRFGMQADAPASASWSARLHSLAVWSYGEVQGVQDRSRTGLGNRGLGADAHVCAAARDD